jgi:opacity protein-like surface antigen
VIDGGAAGLSSKRSGIGDVVVATTYSADLGSGFYFEPMAKVKIPTASTAKRLGTGEVDITAGADFVKEVGPATVYIHGRRKFAGKPAGSNIRSTWGAGAGASVGAGDSVTVGADYDWQQSSLTGNQASSDLTGWASFRLNNTINLSVFGSKGLNNNSADFSGGLTISIKLN